jgi:3',5'-cyclic AMP phosphodiesterase CpdA
MRTVFEKDQTGHSGDRFSFAQISDPHLTTLEGIQGSDLLNKRILGYLSWLKRRRAEHQRSILDRLIQDLQRTGPPDHLVITGDLTHIGLPDEFRQARRWLDSIGTPASITLIPGNHDTYIAAGWDQTLALWQPYMVSDQKVGDGAALFPSLRIRGPAAFIGLSSAVPTLPFLASGTVSGHQLERLEQLLGQTRHLGLFRVVLVHHSPASGVDRRRKRLTNQAGVREVLERQGAELVLHGHTHRSTWEHMLTSRWDIPVIGTPSASAVGHRPGRRAAYHQYRLERGDSHWRVRVEIHRYFPEKEGFQQIGERRLELRIQ